MRNAPAARTWLAVSLLGAAIAAAADLTMIWLGAQRNPRDQFHGQPLVRVLADPFVWAVAIPVVILSALATFLLAILLLRRAVLWKSAALMSAAVLLEIVTVGWRDPVQAWLLSYPILAVAAIGSRWLFPAPNGVRLWP